MAGFRRASQLPEEIRPVLLRTLDYPLLDQYFIWPDVRDAGEAGARTQIAVVVVATIYVRGVGAAARSRGK
jgi:hypothetical protein